MDIARKDRRAILERTRALKMARSVHTYVRGNTEYFYQWLGELDAASSIPVGPPIWICGDAHLGNLGPLADADRKVAVRSVAPAASVAVMPGDAAKGWQLALARWRPILVIA